MLTNRPEFNVVDAGAFHLGATPFSVYNTSSPEQIEYLFSNADNTVVICEAQFLPIIKACGGAPGRSTSSCSTARPPATTR